MGPILLQELLEPHSGGVYLNLESEDAYVAVTFTDASDNIHASTFGAVELGLADYTHVGRLEYTIDPSPDPDDDAMWSSIDVGDELRGRVEFSPLEGVTAFRLSNMTSTEQTVVLEPGPVTQGYPVPLGKLLSFQAFQASRHRPRRFCLDLVLDRSQPFGRHLDDILATFRAALVEQDGSISLRLFEDGAIQHVFTEDEIFPGSFSFEYPSLRDTPNRFVVVFRDAENLYYPAAAIADDETRQRQERRIRAGIVRLDGITRRVQAELIGTYMVRSATHQLHTCRFKVAAQGFRRAPMDLITVSYAPANYAARTFRILAVRPEQGQQVTLECIEHVPSLDSDQFLKRPKRIGAERIEPSALLEDADDILLADSTKASWARKMASWSGGGHVWYRPNLLGDVTAITLPSMPEPVDLLWVQAGNTLLRRQTDASDSTYEWNVTGNRLQFNRMTVGPSADLRIAYIPKE